MGVGSRSYPLSMTRAATSSVGWENEYQRCSSRSERIASRWPRPATATAGCGCGCGSGSNRRAALAAQCAGEEQDKDVANLPSMVTDYVVKRVVVWELGTRDKDEEERRQIRTGRCDGRTVQDCWCRGVFMSLTTGRVWVAGGGGWVDKGGGPGASES